MRPLTSKNSDDVTVPIVVVVLAWKPSSVDSSQLLLLLENQADLF